MSSADTHDTSTDRSEMPRRNWKWLVGFGALSIVAGVLAILNPVLASFAAQAMVGALLIVTGVAQLWMAFADREDGGPTRFMHGALGILMILLAIALIFDPLAGLLSLTIAVAALLVIMGIFRAIFAIRVRPRPGWGWVLASAVLSLILGLLIFSGLPGAAFWVLGMFLGIDLLMSGSSMVALGLAARNA